MRRRDLLIRFANDSQIPMENLDRKCIVAFFERWELSKKPGNIPDLMKTFFTCCFTYAPLRKYLSSVAGSIPTPEMLPDCLSKIYSERAFLVDQNWTPLKLHEIAEKIQERENLDLKSNQFQPRMISVLLDGSLEMHRRLKFGLESFYSELNDINGKSGHEIWAYVSGFSNNIYNVGTALICDFLKDIGCDQFVKVDHHFKNEFPKLLGFSDCKKT